MQTDTSAAAQSDKRGLIWRRAAILASLCIVLALLATSDTLHAALMKVLVAGQQTITRHPLAGALLFVLFAAVSAMFAFVSVAVVVPVAVFTWGLVPSMLLLWAGWILGGIWSYSIGSWLGRAALRWLTAESALRWLEDKVQPTTPFGLVLMFQLALPSEIPGYVLGLVRYSLPKYLLVLGLAELPYAVITVYVGAGFVERRSGLVLTLGLVCVALSIAAFYFLKRQLHSGRTPRSAANSPAPRRRSRR